MCGMDGGGVGNHSLGVRSAHPLDRYARYVALVKNLLSSQVLVCFGKSSYRRPSLMDTLICIGWRNLCLGRERSESR